VKLARATLLTLLALTCVLQCVEGLASIANPAGMMAGLNLSMVQGLLLLLPALVVSESDRSN
jgi:hypothetical protein